MRDLVDPNSEKYLYYPIKLTAVAQGKIRNIRTFIY